MSNEGIEKQAVVEINDKITEKESVFNTPKNFKELFKKPDLTIEENLNNFNYAIAILLKQGLIDEENLGFINENLTKIAENNREAIKKGVYFVANNRKYAPKKVVGE